MFASKVDQLLWQYGPQWVTPTLPAPGPRFYLFWKGTRKVVPLSENYQLSWKVAISEEKPDSNLSHQLWRHILFFYFMTHVSRLSTVLFKHPFFSQLQLSSTLFLEFYFGKKNWNMWWENWFILKVGEFWGKLLHIFVHWMVGSFNMGIIASWSDSS